MGGKVFIKVHSTAQYKAHYHSNKSGLLSISRTERNLFSIKQELREDAPNTGNTLRFATCIAPKGIEQLNRLG